MVPYLCSVRSFKFYIKCPFSHNFCREFRYINLSAITSNYLAKFQIFRFVVILPYSTIIIRICACVAINALRSFHFFPRAAAIAFSPAVLFLNKSYATPSQSKPPPNPPAPRPPPPAPRPPPPLPLPFFKATAAPHGCLAIALPLGSRTGTAISLHCHLLQLRKYFH